MTLADTAVGETVRVTALAESDGGVRGRLAALGFAAGAEVLCAGSAPLGEPRAFLVGGSLIALRREVAAVIACEHG